MFSKEIVITGIGVVSPIGLDLETFWSALSEGRSGVGFVNSLDVRNAQRPMGAEISNFKPKEYFRSKKDVKQIKVMSRDIQLGYASAMLACNDAGLKTDTPNEQGECDRNVDPDRLGVVFGADLIGLDLSELLDTYKAGIVNGKHEFSAWGTSAMEKMFPLWMLKYLPNMPACHIGIAHDARGPNNTLTLQRCSSLAAIIEAARIIDRGAADVMICGGCGNCVNPSFLARSVAHQLADPVSDPSRLPRPFDADRCGSVLAEGAGAFILERRDFAEARGAKIYAAIRGFANIIDPKIHNKNERGEGIRTAINVALTDSGLNVSDLSHINAEGHGTVVDDAIEAAAIKDTLGDVPVTAMKGYVGNSGSGTGAVEIVASLLSLKHGLVPPTHNCEKIASDCPINVVHGQPQKSDKKAFMKINNGIGGRTCAVVMEKVS
ncbi:MAG: beta-ketoacyl-[acyl-carrier-protein] synthase family protein [Thermoguttaceae bacterium]